MYENNSRHDPPRGDRRELRDDARYRDDIAEQIERLEAARGAIKRLRPPENLPSADEGRAIKACNLPVQVGETVVRSISVTDGRPGHGAMMSGAHLSSIEVEMPLREISSERADIPDECPECDYDRGVFHYQRTHNIAGSLAIECDFCGETFEEDTW